jgi:hypothetical protein
LDKVPWKFVETLPRFLSLLLNVLGAISEWAQNASFTMEITSSFKLAVGLREREGERRERKEKRKRERKREHIFKKQQDVNRCPRIRRKNISVSGSRQWRPERKEERKWRKKKIIMHNCHKSDEYQKDEINRG